MKNFYRNKIVIVTGATSGIGADLAELLTSWGSLVIAVGRRESLLMELQEKCSKNLGKLHYFCGDVSNLDEMKQISEKIKMQIGLPHIIIANAGLGGINPADHFDTEIDKKIMTVNYFGMINTFFPFLSAFIARKEGHLVGISSLAAFRGLPNACSYSASKSAQTKLLESFRVDLKKHNIKVSSIHPGFIRTPMTKHDEFPLPFMVDVRKSSYLILKAIKKNRSTFLYPFPMKLITYLNRLLPNWLYDLLLPIVSKSNRSGEKTAKIF